MPSLVPIEKKIQIAKEKIEGGDRDGSFEFVSLLELCGYIDIEWGTHERRKEKVYDAGFSVVRHCSIGEKIQIAKEKIEGGDRDGSFYFRAAKDFYLYADIADHSYQSHKDSVKNAGFVIDNLTLVEQKIEIAKEKIEGGDRGGCFEFGSALQLYIYLDISEKSFKKHKVKIYDAGFSDGGLSVAGQKIQIAKEKIEGGDRGGSFEFGTETDLFSYIDITYKTFKYYLEEICDAGFGVLGPIPTEEKIQIAKNKIMGGDRGGSFEFDTKKEIYGYIGISEATFANHKEKIYGAGFSDRSLSSDQKIRNAKEKIESGDNGGKFTFSTLKELCSYIGISASSFKRLQEKVFNAGFSINRTTTVEQKIQIAKEKIEGGDRGGSFKFKTQKKLCRYIGVATSSLEPYKENIFDAGFLLESAACSTSRSKNMQLSLEDCRLFGIKMESIELLPQLSQEFFSRHVRSDSTILGAWSELDDDIVSDFSKKEIKDKVSAAVLNLISEDKADYSMLELKLELFAGGVYFGEDSILEALLALGELGNPGFEDNIQKRLRLCASIAEKGFIDIDYVEKLPFINNSENGNIIIDKRIRSKKDFLKLWKEYTLFSIKNHITGFVTKSKLPDDWEGDLGVLFEKNPSYQSAYFLDSEGIKFLKMLGYEGILAMCQFGSKQSKKALPKKYHSIHARCIGFFLHLNRKKLALFHPKYFVFTGASSVSDTAKKILDGHVVLNEFKEALKAPDIPKSDLSKLQKKNVPLHGLKLAGSVLEGCNLQVIPSEDIYSYLEHSSHESISGTILHETFVLTLLRLLGNRGAMEKDKVFNIDEEIDKYVIGSEADKDTLLNYKELLEEMFDVVRHRFREGKTHGYIRSYLLHISHLMQYLSIFPKKLDRKEMSEVLNTITVSKDKKSFDDWRRENDMSESKYHIFTQRIYFLFDAITNEEYAKLYNREWRTIKGKRERTLIREGLESVVYETLQDIALYDPPNAHEYPFFVSTPDGELVDMSWWKYDFSPIPVVCQWLILKLARRKIAIRHLDVNTFLQYDESGQIKSIFVNTDKNRNSNEREISIHLLKFIFTEEEFCLLEKYAEYIKSVYSNMSKVSYSNSANSYEDIMPLFPHHERNAVIAESWVDGYFNKTMLKTELLVKKNVAEGKYDRYFGEHERETRKQILSEITLLKEKSPSRRERPEKLDELDRHSLAYYRRRFTTVQGIHNLRHAGISALGAKLPLVYVRMIAGHSDINTTARIYFHANEEIIAKEVLGTDFSDLSEPAKMGSYFIGRNILPLVESGDPQKIEEELRTNYFMSCPREIMVGKDRKWIENGVELASEVHPSTWEEFNHGICPYRQCPTESRGCCALCPYLIFSPMHIKGVNFRLNKSFLDFNVILQKMGMDGNRNINTSHKEQVLEVEQKWEEVAAWLELSNQIREKLSSVSAEGGKTLTLMGMVSGTSNIASFRSCSLDESMIELLADAERLKVDNVGTDNYKKSIFSKIVKRAIAEHDFSTLQKMEEGSIKWFIDEYGKKTFLEKKEFLLRELGSDEPVDNSPSLGAGSDVVKLLPVG